MVIKYEEKDKLLIINITEEIDHHTTEIIRRRVDYEIQRLMPRKVIFDFNSVLFMDSAGVGMIIGRYKTCRTYGGMLELKNVKPKIERILSMSGITKIIPIIDNNYENNMYTEFASAKLV